MACDEKKVSVCVFDYSIDSYSATLKISTVSKGTYHLFGIVFDLITNNRRIEVRIP